MEHREATADAPAVAGKEREDGGEAGTRVLETEGRTEGFVYAPYTLGFLGYTPPHKVGV